MIVVSEDSIRTEVDGGADDCEGLRGAVSWLSHGIRGCLFGCNQVFLHAPVRTWSGVNHQRLPVDAIAADAIARSMSRADGLFQWGVGARREARERQGRINHDRLACDERQL